MLRIFFAEALQLLESRFLFCFCFVIIFFYQVAAHAVYSLSLLIASARQLAHTPPPREKGSFSSTVPQKGSFSAMIKGSFSSSSAQAPKGSFSSSTAPVGGKGSFSSTTASSNGSAGDASFSSLPAPKGGFFGQDGNQVLLDYFAGQLRDCCRHAAMKLMVRLEGKKSVYYLQYFFWVSQFLYYRDHICVLVCGNANT